MWGNSELLRVICFVLPLTSLQASIWNFHPLCCCAKFDHHLQSKVDCGKGWRSCANSQSHSRPSGPARQHREKRARLVCLFLFSLIQSITVGNPSCLKWINLRTNNVSLGFFFVCLRIGAALRGLCTYSCDLLEEREQGRRGSSRPCSPRVVLTLR